MNRLDWLDLPDDPPAEKPVAVLTDTDKRRMATVAKARRAARTEKTTELTRLFDELTLEQRFWIKALVANRFSVRKARKALKERGLPTPEPYKVSRWGSLPAFAKTRDLAAELAYDAEAPTKAALMMRLQEIAEYNIEEVDEFHQGEPTGRTQMRDVAAALKATEMQGKQLKMFGEEHSNVREGPMLIVQVISKDDPTKVVDVTPGRIAVQRPGDDIVDAEPADE